MSLVVLTKFTFTQTPTAEYPSRNKAYVMNFVNDFKVVSTWENLTDMGSIIFPKKIYFQDQEGETVTWDGQSIIGTSNPILLRGDKVSIQAGYTYFDIQNIQRTDVFNIFTGYISRITPSLPIEIELQDNMYLLKQIQAPSTTWTGSLQSMVQSMIAGTGFTVRVDNNETTSIGKLITGNETVCQVLDRLRKFRLFSYFRGNVLTCGGLVYYPSDATLHVFKFQNNIIDYDLEYVRTDDIILAAQVNSLAKTQLTTTNSKGQKKTKLIKVSVFIYYNNGKLITVDKRPVGYAGEIRTYNFLDITDTEELSRRGQEELAKLAYPGLRGSITVFGTPYVQHGDHVQLINDDLPEYNGTYLVRKVEYTGAIDGLRQRIYLDIKLL